MRAFNLGCYPWHGYLEISFLTVNENMEGIDYPKYAIGDWRWYDFTSTFDNNWTLVEELAKWVNEFYEESENTKETLELIFETCAKVLTSKDVIEELKKYTLTEDFEVSVFNGDESMPQENYCSKYNPKFF